MRTFALVALLACHALAAPQGEVASEEKKEKEVRQVVPEARQLISEEVPQVLLQDPQFGARINPQYYYQPQAQQYYPGQALSYIRGNPAQAYYSGDRYYTGAQYVQPQVIKKTVVKTTPSIYTVPQVAYAGQPLYRPAPAPLPVPVVKAAPLLPAAAPLVPVLKSAAPVVAPVSPLLKTALPEPTHAILRSSHDDNFDGSFTYGYETDHGIIVESSGFLKNAGTEDEAQVIQGSYTWYTAEGVPITTTYIADENGFQVQGDHLPVAPQEPELPPLIAKSLAYQRSLPPSPEELEAQAKLAAKL